MKPDQHSSMEGSFELAVQDMELSFGDRIATLVVFLFIIFPLFLGISAWRKVSRVIVNA